MPHDISHMNEKIFGDTPSSADLYLKGYIPNGDTDFGISFDGKYSVVPFRVCNFATREVYYCKDRKIRLNDWAKKNIDEINRFLSVRNLSAALKKGDSLELFVEFSDNLNWDGISYIPANALRKYSVF